MPKSVKLFLGLFAFIVLCAAIRFVKFPSLISSTRSLFTTSNKPGSSLTAVGAINASALRGKWDFVIRSSSYREITIIKGVAIYNQQDQFVKRITYKYYSNGNSSQRVNESEGDERVLAGGTISGTWATIDSYWIETSTKCTIEPSIGNLSTDEICSIINNYSRSGNIINDTKSFELKQVNSDQIIIEGEDLSNEGKISIIYTRKN